MNKISALKHLITSKIRATKSDISFLQIPDELELALNTDLNKISFSLGNLPASIPFKVVESENTISSKELFTNSSGKRYSCWLDGDENLVDDWLLSGRSYPYYHQIYSKLGIEYHNPKLLEFGTRSGYSGVVFAKSIKGPSTYIGIDPNLYVTNGLEKASETFKQLNIEGFQLNFFLIEGFSSSSSIQNSLKFSGPYEFIHIDGEHTLFGKIFDLWISKNIVSENGYILVDDYDHHELVRKSIELACHLGWFSKFSYVNTYRGMAILKK